MDTESDDFDDESAGPAQPDLLKSYLAFAVRAIRSRRLLVISVFMVGLLLTIGAAAVWPRTYHCEMKLMIQRSLVLGDEANANPLSQASEVIERRESLLAIVQQAELAKNWSAHRPPLLRVKDSLTSQLFGKPSDEGITNALISYLGTKLWAQMSDNTLTIGADWPDGTASARLVEAAHQVFMASRHAAEISTIQEKIAILDGHASKARDDLDRLAEQLQRIREERLAQAGKAVLGAAADPLPSATPAAVVAPRPRVVVAGPDESLPALKEELETKKRTAADLETDRNRRLLDAQAKVADLQLKYTAAHPSVRAAEQTVASLSQESPRVAALRGEIQSLEKIIKERGAIVRSDGGGGGGVAAVIRPSGAGSDALSSEIMKLLDAGAGIDPALSAQLSGAVNKYAALRDAISTARIDLDKAQAAFNYRYKVILPPEAPSKPSKPKVLAIVGGGIAAALVLALLLPIGAELRKGVIVERWQVYQMQLPILAELKYPPGSSD